MSYSANGVISVNAIGQEQTSALAALKSSDELISESLKTELEATRKQLAQKVFEFDEMKEQLVGALVSREKTQRKLDEAMAAGSNGQPAPEEIPKGKKEDTEKIEKLRAALKLKIEVSYRASMQVDFPYVVSRLGCRFPFSPPF